MMEFQTTHFYLENFFFDDIFLEFLINIHFTNICDFDHNHV